MTSKINNGGIGNPVNVDGVRRRLHHLVAEQGAGSVEPTGLPYAGGGILVGLGTHGLVLDVARADAVVIAEWIRTVAPVVTERALRPRVFGAWTSSGRLYLDVSEVFPSDCEAEALQAARSRGELAVWHAGRGVEIPTEAGPAVCDACEDEIDVPVRVDGRPFHEECAPEPDYDAAEAALDDDADAYFDRLI